MSVLIKPILGSVRFEVTGEIKTVLSVPYDDDDRFLIGLSEGTLLQGSYDEGLRCVWKLVTAGTGVVWFETDSVIVDGQIEWVTASAYDANLVDPPVPLALPLFPELDREAA